MGVAWESPPRGYVVEACAGLLAVVLLPLPRVVVSWRGNSRGTVETGSKIKALSDVFAGS